MGVPQAMQTLSERAAFTRESLQKSQTITDSMVAILGSFDHRLSALETAMRPTQVFLHFLLVWFPWKIQERTRKWKEDCGLYEFCFLILTKFGWKKTQQIVESRVCFRVHSICGLNFFTATMKSSWLLDLNKKLLKVFWYVNLDLILVDKDAFD